MSFLCHIFAEKGCNSCYMYMYGYGSSHCIQPEIICDGYNDCYNGVDERGCGK